MIGVTSVVCVIMTLRAVHGNSTSITTSLPPPSPTETTTTTPSGLTQTAITSSTLASTETTTESHGTNGQTTSPASGSSSAVPTILTSSSVTNPTNTKSGLNQQEQIAIISFAVLAIAALIVAFVAVLSVRINRAREKPRPIQMEMRHMNGNPSVMQEYPSSQYSSRISDDNASGSRGNVSFEALVKN